MADLASELVSLTCFRDTFYMNLNMSSAELRNLLLLVHKRDQIRLKLTAIDAMMPLALQGSPLPKSGLNFISKTIPNPKLPAQLSGRVFTLPEDVNSNTRSTKASGKRKKRGPIKELIFGALREAGEAGVAVKHLAQKLGTKPVNIHAWFASTGKKSGLVKALGKGVYRLEQSMGAQTSTVSLKAPKPKKAQRRKHI